MQAKIKLDLLSASETTVFMLSDDNITVCGQMAGLSKLIFIGLSALGYAVCILSKQHCIQQLLFVWR